MADILLSRPQAGQQAVVAAPADSRLVLQFPADQATLEKSGDNLVFRFEDGASVEVPNFYTEFNKDNIPDFVVDGQLVAGADFFNAFGPDLAPAAGPGAGAAARAARYNDWANSNLLDGINHLDGLDWGMNLANRTEDDWQGDGLLPDDNRAPVLSTGGAPLVDTLIERGWDGKSTTYDKVATKPVSFSISDPEGDSLSGFVYMGGKPFSIIIGGTTKAESDYGTLEITTTGGGGNLTITYTYALKEPESNTGTAGGPVDRLAKGEEYTETIRFSFNDGHGNVVTQPVNLTIVGSNDAPDITRVDDLNLKEDGVYAEGERLETTLAAKENTFTPDASGAKPTKTAEGYIKGTDPDNGASLTFRLTGEGATLEVSQSSPVASATLTHGTLTLTFVPDPDAPADPTKFAARYTFTLNDAATEVNSLGEGDTVSLSFAPWVSDGVLADGKVEALRGGGSIADADGALTITIKGTNDRPWVESAKWDGADFVKEDSGSYTITGRVKGDDHDSGDQASLSFGLVMTVPTDSKPQATVYDTLYVVDNGAGKPVLSDTAPGDDNYYGTLTMNKSTGTYTFTLNNDAKVVQQMGSKDSKEVNFTVAVQDQWGAWDTKPVTLTITGANDAPVFTEITYTNGNVVKEAGVHDPALKDSKLKSEEHTPTKETTDADPAPGQHKLSVAGTVKATDVDLGDAGKLKYGLVVNGESYGKDGDVTVYVKVEYNAKENTFSAPEYTTTKPADNDPSYLGKMVMQSDGSFTFTLHTPPTGTEDYVANRLGEKQSVNLSFTPTAHDGTTYNTSAAPEIKITIKGTNDRPELSGPDVLDIEERANDTSPRYRNGKVFVEDVDAGDTHTYSLVVNKDLLQDHNTLKDGISEAPLAKDLYVKNVGGKATLVTEKDTNANHDDYYGRLSVDSNGTYTFKLYNDSKVVQALDDDSTPISLPFTVAVQDQWGAWDTKPITLTIKGANDKPVFTTGAAGAVKELGVFGGPEGRTDTLVAAENDANIKDNKDKAQFQGKPELLAKDTVEVTVKAHDVDDEASELTFGLAAGGVATSATKVYALADGTITDVAPADNNYYGFLELISQGAGEAKYKFTLNDHKDSPANKLGENQTKDLFFSPTVKDEAEPVVAQGDKRIKITIHGTNDKPVLDMDAKTEKIDYSITRTLVEDGGVYELKGTIKATDSDKEVKDGKMLATEDKPLVYLAVKDGGETLLLGEAYVDKNGNVVKDLPSDGNYFGKIIVNPDSGDYTFLLNNGAPCVQQLGEGAKAPLKITFAAQDQFGAYDTGTLTVEIQGTDDSHSILSGWLAPSNAVVEAGVRPRSDNTTWEQQARYDDPSDGIPTATGHIVVSDKDASDKGNLSLATDARLHYCIKTDSGTYDLNELAKDAGGIDKVRIDLKYGTLTFAADDKALKEAKDVPTDGKAVLKYIYTLDNDNPEIQAMNFHGKKEDPFEVIIHDTKDPASEVTSSVTISIDGANDRPEIVTAPGLSISEKQTVSDSGQIKLTDAEQLPDAPKEGETVSSGFTFSLVKTGTDYSGDMPVQQGTYGRLTIDQATGEYTYTRTADLTSLAEGSSVTDTFYVRVKDADGAYSEIKPIVVTITGEDAPGRLTGNVLAATEDGVKGTTEGILRYSGKDKLGANEPEPGTGIITGQLKVNDTDTNSDIDRTFLNNKGADSYSTYTYGETLSYTDRTGTHTISRSGDASSGYDYKVGDYGTLHVKVDGSYTFTPDTSSTAFNGLALGEGVRVTLAGITAKNAGQGADTKGSLTLTIKGTNDAPVVEITSLKDDTKVAQWTGKASNLVVTGDLKTESGVTDADSGHTLKFFALHEKLQVAQDTDKDLGLVQALKGKYGTLVIQENGSYQYVLDRANQSYKDLGDNNPDTDTFTVYVRDEHNAVAEPITLTINVKGQNVPAGEVFDGSAKNVEEKVWEDEGKTNSGDPKRGELTATGDIIDGEGTDPDLYLSGTYTEGGEVKGTAGNTSSVITDYGTLTLLPDGKYTFVLNNDSAKVQELKEGDEFKLVFDVTNKYKGNVESPTISITIKGTNDKPYVVSSHKEILDKNNNVIALPDDTVSFTQDADNSWTATDASGSFTLKDIDKGQTAKLEPDWYVNKDGGTSIPVSPNSDGTYTVVGKLGGTFTVTKNGDGTFSYTYKAPGAGPNYSGKVEDWADLTFSNGTTADDRVTVKLSADLVYANDNPGKPVLEASSVTEVTEDVIMVAKGAMTATDPDVKLDGTPKDTLTFSIVGADSEPVAPTNMYQHEYGTLIMNTDGTYTFHLNTSSEKVQALKEGDPMPLNFTIRVSDGQGGHADETLTITVQGTNDAPTIALHAGGSSVAGSGAARFMTDKEASVSGEARTYDVDKGDTLTLLLGDKDVSGSLATQEAYARKNGAAWEECKKGDPGALCMGKWELNAAGEYTFRANADNIAKLGMDEKLELKATIGVRDNSGAANDTATADVTVTITGTNDAPVLTAKTEPMVQHKLSDVKADPSKIATKDGQLAASDPDGDAKDISFSIKADDNVKQTGSNTWEGKYGTLELDASTGKYTYTLFHGDHPKANAVYAMNGDQDYPDVFTVVAKDKFGAEGKENTLTINITGVRDNLLTENAGPTDITVTEGESKTGSFELKYLESKDYGDNAEPFTFGILYRGADGKTVLEYRGEAGPVTDAWGGTFTKSDDMLMHTNAYGTFKLNAKTGEYTYKPSDALAENQTVTNGGGVLLGIRAHNTDGEFWTRDNLKITATGVNDAPVPVSGESAPWSGVLATDAEGDALTFTPDGKDTGGKHELTFGTLKVEADGKYTYTLRTDEAALEKLDAALRNDADKTLTDSFSFKADDGKGAVSGTLNLKIDADNWDGKGGKLMFGDNADNTLNGVDGNDVLYGGKGNDVLYGGEGDDILYGGAGNDRLYGGAGDDTLHGGDGSDFLDGGDGSDFLDGGDGNDRLYGGAGNDLLVYSPTATIDGGEGTDVLLTNRTGSNDMDVLLSGLNGNNSSVKSIEVVVLNGPGTASLTSMKDLSDKGIQIGDDGNVSLTKAWTKGTSVTDANGTAFDVYTHAATDGTVDLTIAVEQTKLSNGS